jgi:hypothetical protein
MFRFIGLCLGTLVRLLRARRSLSLARMLSGAKPLKSATFKKMKIRPVRSPKLRKAINSVRVTMLQDSPHISHFKRLFGILARDTARVLANHNSASPLSQCYRPLPQAVDFKVGRHFGEGQELNSFSSNITHKSLFGKVTRAKHRINCSKEVGRGNVAGR